MNKHFVILVGCCACLLMAASAMAEISIFTGFGQNNITSGSGGSSQSGVTGTLPPSFDDVSAEFEKFKSRPQGNATCPECPDCPECPECNATVVSSDLTYGMLYVGGRKEDLPKKDPADPTEVAKTVWIEQAMVHTIVPAANATTPVIFVPGLGLSSYMYMATPDGRKSWGQYFAEGGHPVYALDLPEYSISGGFSVERTNALFSAMAHNKEYFGNPYATNETAPCMEIEVVGKKGTTIQTICPEPLPQEVPPPTKYSYYNNEAEWETWGFGPNSTASWPESQYPSAYIDQFWKHMPIRFNDAEDGVGPTGDIEADSVLELLNTIGEPAVLSVHSAAGGISLSVLQQPAEVRSKIKCLILQEPAFHINTPNKLGLSDPTYRAAIEDYVDNILGEIPILFIYGDITRRSRQDARKASCLDIYTVCQERITAGLRTAPAGFIDMQLYGGIVGEDNSPVLGNTHIHTQDLNNDVIAGKVLKWLKDNNM
jgi:pimeloyl-ACP methyl ester carboxylesterase